MKVLFVTLTRHDEPLGIMYLSAALKKQGHEVRGVMIEKENIEAVVGQYNPTIVGYSAMSCEKNKILKINAMLKRKYSFFSIIGGPLVTLEPEIIDNESIDAVCIGEGEEAMVELVNALENKGDITKIKNVWVKSNGHVLKNEERPLIQDLDSLHFPDRIIFKNMKEGTLYNLISSRGCPYNCTYCYNKSYKEMYHAKGAVVRYRGVDNIIKEIKEITDKFNQATFFFQEDHFFPNLDNLKEFTNKYKKHIDKPFIVSLRPEFLTNEEVARALKSANCIAVFTGLESGNDRIRREVLKRNTSKEQLFMACDLLRKHSIHLVLHNMVGIPTSNFENDLETLELNIECKPYYSWASICTPYPGTELLGIAKEAGEIDGKYLENLRESFHIETSLNIPHKHMVNILHKIFALCVEYPMLLPIIRKPGFYDNMDKNELTKLKAVFDKFKEYKYKQLYDQKEESVPEVVERFVNKLIDSERISYAVGTL